MQNIYKAGVSILTALLAGVALAGVTTRSDPDRAIYDIESAAPGRGETVLKLVFGSPAAKLATGRTLDAFSVHLKSGKGWFAYPHPVAAAENGRTVYLPLDAFTADGNAAGLGSVSGVRISAWGGGTGAAGEPKAIFVRPSIGVVADAAFGRDRIRARLGGAIQFFDVKDMKAIRQFSEDGGKIVVAYSSNPALAEFMGVTPGSWLQTDVSALADGNGKVIAAYKTGCVFAPRIPAKNRLHAHITAWLLDPRLQPLGLAGAVETDRGIWYAHGVPASAMAAGPITRLPDTLTVRGVWTDGAPLDPEGWDRMMRRLAATGINTVFVRSDAKNADTVLRAGKRTGIAVHAWMIAFGATHRQPGDKADRAAVLNEVRRLAKAGYDGVELDYFRYPSGALTTDAAKDHAAAELTALLGSIHSAIKYGHPGVKLSVAVFPIPKTQRSVGQDVAAWVKGGLVDFVSPMCYTESVDEFKSMVAEDLATVKDAKKLVVGIGTGADESRLDAAGVDAQVSAASAAGYGGIAFFMLDAELAARLQEAAR